jgi:pimeloyl-ACP methyl ester carboxylesterase
MVKRSYPFMPLLPIKVIKPLVQTVSVLAPRLTGKFAFRAFCRTPNPVAADKRQRDLVARAERSLAGAQRSDVDIDGVRVAVYRFAAADGMQSRGTVALIHGWGGRAAFMTTIAAGLTRQGFDAVLVDLPGHGASAGRKLHLALALGALTAIHRQYGPWQAMVGHSFGGAIATAAATGVIASIPAIPVKKLVLIASPNSLADVFRGFGAFIGLRPSAQAAMEREVVPLAGREIDYFVADRLLAASSIKTLILHAPDDKEVAYSNAEAMAQAGEFVSLTAMPGLGHRRIVQAAATAVATADFLAADFLAPSSLAGAEADRKDSLKTA